MKTSEVLNNKFVVLGAARSGIAAARLLKRHGADVVVADSKAIGDVGHELAELQMLEIPAIWDDEAASAITGRSIMIKSPGIPQTNSIVTAARSAGIRIISEIELASAFVPDGARVIAITGTNGKTTTTAWTAHVLNASGYKAILAGNIGDAWCNRVEDLVDGDPDKLVFVVEVSSFQLEDLEDFQPDIAMMTNISADHMDRYDDRMDLYVAAKANLLRNTRPDSIFIWNKLDSESQIIAQSAIGVKWAFQSGAWSSELAAGVENDMLMLRSPAGPVALLEARQLPLPGKHNLDNALCAALAAMAIGAQPAAIAMGLKSFPGVEHRIELCGERADGVRFYNDSKATNLDAMEKAVLAFDQPIVLIAGGRDAHSDYPTISDLVKKHVIHLITIGEAAPLIEDSWSRLVPTRRAGSMAEAVAMANAVAKPGNVIVFSPACKSFDMYANFEERGRDFKRQVSKVLS